MRFRLVILLGLLPVALSARQVPITILHTCDLHGNVLPTESYEGQTNLGGIARCATVIRQVRAAEKNVLLVDAGDTIQGAPVSFYSQGQVMVKALNLLRYDAWCWGNHEFDWGLPTLTACAKAAQMPILNANLRADVGRVTSRGEGVANHAASGDAAYNHAASGDTAYNHAASGDAAYNHAASGDAAYNRAASGDAAYNHAEDILSLVKPYRLVEVDGVKVGIIGLNTPGIPNWSRPRLIAGLRFADSVETLRPIIPALRRAGAQVLVLVCHQGYRDNGDDHANQVNAIARMFPELDVIIGAHTHRHFPEFKIANVLYCQANYYGIHLGRVDLVYDTEAGKLVRRESKTILMDGAIPLDTEVLKTCGAELDHAQKTLATVVGEATDDFDARGQPKRETPVHNLICEAIAESLRARGVKVDGVVHGLFGAKGLRKGPITVADVWKIVPYENTVGVLQLTPAQLKDVLEENAASYERREFRGIWGLRCTLDPAGGASNRVVRITRADGSPLKDDERLAVAFNSYELASGGLRWKKLRELADAADTKLAEFDIQTRQAVIDFIRQRGRITPLTRGWWKTQRGSFSP